MRKVLFAMFLLVLAVSGGCASAGLGGYGSGVHGVVAANQAMIAGLAAQAIQPLYASVPGYGNVPVCRLRDLAGLPQLNNPAIVRVDKSKGHKTIDVISGAAIVGTVVYLATSDPVAAGIGTVGGVGGGLAVSSHEYDLCLFLPVKMP